MKNIFIIILLFISAFSAVSQEVDVINFSELEPDLYNNSDTIFVINFWATWCKPCTEEMPGLLELSRELRDKNFQMILVSLDMPSQMDARVVPYIVENGISEKVLLLDDPDFNSWIPKVSDNWSGSIPATLVYSGDFRKFHEGAISYEKLKKIVVPLLND